MGKFLKVTLDITRVNEIYTRYIGVHEKKANKTSLAYFRVVLKLTFDITGKFERFVGSCRI